MNVKSIHKKINSILKKFDKDYDKVGRVQKVALKEPSKLSKSLKKGIN